MPSSSASPVLGHDLDGVNYPSHDSLATLAAVAGTTSRIELLTNILLAPAYPPVLLAKHRQRPSIGSPAVG